MVDGHEQVRTLWEKYYMLTTELLKFITAQDVDEFLELVDQRRRMLEMIQSADDKAYEQTEECQQLFEKIRPLDMQIIYKAKSWLNKSKKRNMAVKSYDLLGQNPIGHAFNRRY